MSRSSEIMALQRRVAELSRRLDNRPILGYQAPRAQYRLVQVVSGQTLGTGQIGVKYKTTPITSVPTAYDPNATSSFVDGIGRGILYIDNLPQSGYVLILNDSTCPILRVLVAGDFISTLAAIDMTVDAGGTVPVYPGWFL